MATASSSLDTDAAPAALPRGRLARPLARVARSWMFIAFFVGFFPFWEHSIDLFGIPRYILPKPSEIVTQLAGPTSTGLLYYTWVTGSEALHRLCPGGADRRAASASPSPSRRCCGAPSIPSSSASR